MTVLGIETSCDETSAGIVRLDAQGVQLLSNITATSLPLHAKTGGIIPEIAAREQVKCILPVIEEALNVGLNSTIAQNSQPQLDAIAVTYGPGLIGSLLVGVETAKTLSILWNIPLIPVNHMMGHIYANFIRDISNEKKIEFPAIALVVSGGHTDLLLLKNHGDYILLGGTRDDAAGEAFDKIGRLLGMTYPAGPAMEQHAKKGDPKRFNFPRPLKHDDSYEFSFSGLKTAAYREIQKLLPLDDQTIADVARCIQDAIIDVLVTKTLRATKEFSAKSILLSGGVAANQTLRQAFDVQSAKLKVESSLFVPEKSLCTDNGAMIAAAALFQNNPVSWQDITADPELYYVIE